MIVFDLDARRLDVELSDAEIPERLRPWSRRSRITARRLRQVRGAGLLGVGGGDHAASVS